MKRIISALLIFVFLYTVGFNAFSFVIDGKDNGVEWDGASVYKLVDGESNCGVNFGLVKVKFDYDGNAVCLCFHFIDPELLSDNGSAGVWITVDDSASFEIIASDGVFSENVAPYSFDGAVYIDENNGATCEIRVGIKSGLPENIDFDVRFIDSQGYYSDYYYFVITNELFEATEPSIINPSSDNNDPAYNPDIITAPIAKTTKYKTTRSTTAKKTTTKKSTTSSSKHSLETASSYSYAIHQKTTATKKSETENIILKSSESAKTNKVIEEIHYYEKEIYISEVYITQTQEPSSTVSETDYTNESKVALTTVSLSKGTKYKKIFSAAAFVGLLSLAFIGVHTAKKSKTLSNNKD